MLTFGFKYELTVNGKTSVEPQVLLNIFAVNGLEEDQGLKKCSTQQHCESNRSAEIP